jgi:20S proteasome alpha/beta subunit
MTLIIGIKCRDGLVLGADGAATYAVLGQQTIRQPVKKKLRVGGSQQVVVGTSGSVGIGQRVAGEVEAIQRNGIPVDGQPKKLAQTRPHEAMAALRQSIWRIVGSELEIARAASQMIGSGLPIQAAMSQSLVALLVGNEPCLFQFDHQGMPEQVTEDLPFVAIGSGQLIADPFLAFLRRIYWPTELPDVEQGVFTTVWALHHAIATHPGGVGMPIQLITFRKEDDKIWRAKEVPEQRWQEALQAVDAIEKGIQKIPKQLQEDGNAPPPPQPGS